MKRLTLQFSKERKLFDWSGIRRDVGTRRLLKRNNCRTGTSGAETRVGLQNSTWRAVLARRNRAGLRWHATHGGKRRNGVCGGEFPPRNSQLHSMYVTLGFVTTIDIRGCSVFDFYRLDTRGLWLRGFYPMDTGCDESRGAHSSGELSTDLRRLGSEGARGATVECQTW